VVNPTIEWVSSSPTTQKAETTSGGVTDADYAASVAALGSDEEDDDEAEAAAAVAAVNRVIAKEQSTQDAGHVAPTLPKPAEEPTATRVSTQAPAVAATPAVPKMSCRKCKAFFETRKELGKAFLLQRKNRTTKQSRFTCGHAITVGTHMRSDWHRHNLKRHLKGIGPIAQEGFDALTGWLRRVLVISVSKSLVDAKFSLLCTAFTRG